MKKYSEYFTISEKTQYTFLKLLLSILTTHLDWKLHLNDSIGEPWKPSNLGAHGLQQNYTEDNASRNSMDHNKSAGI